MIISAHELLSGFDAISFTSHVALPAIWLQPTGLQLAYAISTQRQLLRGSHRRQYYSVE